MSDDTMSRSNIDQPIIVAVDGSPASRAAIEWAAEEALLHGRRLTLVHAVAPVYVDTHDPVLRARIQRWRIYSARELLADTKADLVQRTQLDADAVATVLQVAHPVHILTQVSQHAAMLVLGSRFHGSWGGRRLGSVSAALCYRAHCPVAVVHTHRHERETAPVLVGVDGSVASDHAVSVAFEEAARRRVGLVAVHAWSDENVLQLIGADWDHYRADAETALHTALLQARVRYPGVTVTEKVFCDRPAHWLIKEAEHAGLVVVGSHGRGVVSALLNGSVATAVAERADVPVIIARAG
ncbi:universal stress protein [Mycolicibacterium sp. 120266]|uniref:universal stress protein n=1 Tax=Mycolicibacterium sp. 120266 TaxID=3090601 RepID=UPI00299D8585|nr:universal stress protein [Mycolicibacterium sp. 120266]MDX1875158.1 universal stress protein [Mycolicibacterium sp. 120266]